MPKLLKHSIAVKEASARFGFGTSRYHDFMTGWQVAACTPEVMRKKSLSRHGRSLRHQKR